MVLFTLIPRKVSIPASEAGWIIVVVRAFYEFLKREFSSTAQAEDCLRVLGDDSVLELEAALSDRRNFGMAKSMFMGGVDAGFDMSTQASMSGCAPRNSQPAAWGPSWGGGAPQKSKARPSPDAKKKRQAVRKARRKNR